jgi:hypothetical protein
LTPVHLHALSKEKGCSLGIPQADNQKAVRI